VFSSVPRQRLADEVEQVSANRPQFCAKEFEKLMSQGVLRAAI
jgi:hypothetical protein